MKPWRLLVFSFLFVVAVAVYLYQTRLERQALTGSPGELNRTFILGNKNVPDRLEIHNHPEKSRLVLMRKGESWILTIPVLYPADSQKVEELAVELQKASQQPRLRATKPWEEYGLAKPEIEMVIDVPGKKSEMLSVGTQVPVGNATFARWNSERGYFLLPSEVKEMLQQSVYSFREKRLFRAPRQEIQKVYIEMGLQSYQWKKEGDQWYWLEPLSKFGQKMPPDSMAKVLAGLQGLYIKEFLDNNKKSMAELGFFMIHDRIRIDSDFNQSEVFHFGNEVPLQNAFLGSRENEPVVFLVDRGKVIQLWDLLKTVENDNENSKKQITSPKQ